MPPGDRFSYPFPAANDDFRSQRLRAALACHLYNRNAEDASPQQRVELWNNIVKADKPLSQNQLFQFDQSNELDDASEMPPSPTRERAVPVRSSDSLLMHRGTHSDSEDPLETASVVTSHTLTDAVTLVEASPPSKGFPGQGLAPYLKPPVHIDYGTTLEIAPSTFINRGCKILDTPVGSVKIGERCLIGPDFHVYAVSHPLDYRKRNGPAGAPSYALNVEIGDDCWIGGRVTVLGSVKIGKGCVIGANSLVNRDIPPYHLAFGSPARVVRRVAGPPDDQYLWTWTDIRAVLAGWYNRRWRGPQFLLAISIGINLWVLYQLHLAAK